MTTFAPMECHLTTDRLVMRPWIEDDAAWLRDLHAERGDGTPTLAETRGIIEASLARTEATGIALLPIRRRIACQGWKAPSFSGATSHRTWSMPVVFASMVRAA
ncbi:hypothetical protein [Glycomyces sp. MUSA5-2]|uniref:hypothetical protein n=1 Tax=Glycomyces sp. MUSA5-2 TaxID=2053002 RepID=UPI003008253A